MFDVLVPPMSDAIERGVQASYTRRWAKRGTRPSAPKDQRTKSAYIFGAICPELGKGAGLILPFCNTQTMSLHLAEISLAIEPGAHGVLLMDQAGWHMTGKLEVPENISIVPLPPKCPELNPVENIWQFMRDNWLSNRIFTSHDNIIDICCEAWNTRIECALIPLSSRTRSSAIRSASAPRSNARWIIDR